MALFVKALGGFFAIMNPFVALPMFLSLTNAYDAARQRRTALRVTLSSLALAAVIMAAGSWLLRFFGISVDDFRVAGGLVVAMIALGMLNGGATAHQGTPAEQEHHQQLAADAESDISFYPLTFPLIVGPGTITTIMVFTSQAADAASLLAVAAAICAVLAMLFVVLWFAPAIGHRMSASLRVIMTRLMGMILIAIAVEMIITGLLALVPGLAK